MAYSENQATISLTAAADLSGKQFRFVSVDSSGKAAAPSDGDKAIGVLQNKPAAGQAATICISGVSQVNASAAIAAGAAVTCDGTSGNEGDGKTAVSADYRLGIALTAASAADEVISVLVQQNGLVA